MELKDVLGEELAQQVEEKLGDNHTFIDKSEGKWIPKEKFDSKNEEADSLKTQLQERDTQLNDLQKKASNSDELSQEIQRLKDENQTKDQEYQAKLEAKEKDFQIEKALRDANARHPDLIKREFNTDHITVKDGKLIGFDEQMNQVKEKYSDLFEEEKPKGLQGKQPVPGDDGGRQKPDKNPFAQETLNLTEQARIMKEDPDLAQKLKSQAK